MTDKQYQEDFLFYSALAESSMTPLGEPVYLSDGVWLYPPTKFKHKPYTNRCWHCAEAIDSEINQRCTICGWYICSCGACAEGCQRGWVKGQGITR